MHRLVLTSSAFRQTSKRTQAGKQGEQVDPENQLLWRQRMRRLEAEPLRDSVLFVAGTLRARMHGSPIPVERHSSGEVTTLTGRDRYRRSIYLQILRLNPLTMLGGFDQPIMETNCVRRSESTVSTQALTLLNSDTMVNAAEQMAAQLLQEEYTRIALPVRAFERAFSRRPTTQEARALSDFISEQTDRQLAVNPQKVTREAAHKAALADLCHMLMTANEFIYID